MNSFDVLLVAVIGLFLWLGWQKGFISGLTDLVIWLASLACGFLFYTYVSTLLSSSFNSLASFSKPLSFLLLLFLSRLIFSLVANRLLQNVTPQTHSHKINKTFGLLPGFVNGVLNAGILAALFLVVPVSNAFFNGARDSKAASVVGEPLGWLNEKLSPIFSDAFTQTAAIKKFTPAPNETVNLPFKVANTEARPALEYKMFELVNSEREKEGLKKLSYDPALVPVARLHSKDMFARGYFSHYSPEGKTVADRLKGNKIRYLAAGENLALAPTLNMAHTGLMNSPGHRANILHKSYGKIGIGIVDGGIRGIMVTQIFKN